MRFLCCGTRTCSRWQQKPEVVLLLPFTNASRAKKKNRRKIDLFVMKAYVRDSIDPIGIGLSVNSRNLANM